MNRSTVSAVDFEHLVSQVEERQKLKKTNVGFHDGAIFDKRLYRKTFAYQDELARHLEIESDLAGLDVGARASEIRRCSRVVVVDVCNDCGQPLPRSASFENRTCKTRGCLFCAHKKALETVEWFYSACTEVPLVNGYCWQYITQTVQYDPRNQFDVDVKALKHRTFVCKKLSKKLWLGLLKKENSCAHRTIEVGCRGHVHLNFVYYGPKLEAADISAFCQKVSKEAGVAYVSQITETTCSFGNFATELQMSSSDVSSICSVVGYINKGIPGSSYVRREEHLAGEMAFETIDPKLAARWDVATRNLTLSINYGTLRGTVTKIKERNKEEKKRLKKEKNNEHLDRSNESIEDNKEVQAKLIGSANEQPVERICACGCEEFVKQRVEVEKWIRYCHYTFEQPGFENGQWNKRIGWKSVYVNSS